MVESWVFLVLVIALGLSIIWLVSHIQPLQNSEHGSEIVYEGRLGGLEQQLAELRKALDAKPVVVNPANVPEIVQALETKIADLNERLGKLESAIESSPEKALAIPLLRKDIEDEKQNVLRLRADVAQIYDCRGGRRGGASWLRSGGR
jgi:predicted  nucleic acid-binding Zn-ribbon protein